MRLTKTILYVNFLHRSEEKQTALDADASIFSVEFETRVHLN